MKRRSTTTVSSQGMRALLLLLALLLVFAGCNTTQPPIETAPSEESSTGEETTTLEETTDTSEETTEPNIIWGGRDPIPYFYSNFKENNDGRMITINVDNFDFGMVYHLSSCEEENGVYRNPTFIASFIREINDDDNELNSGAYWLTLEAVDITDYPEITAEVLKQATWQLTDDLPDGDIRGVLVYNEIELYKIFIEGATVEAKDIVEDVLEEISNLLIVVEY